VLSWSLYRARSLLSVGLEERDSLSCSRITGDLVNALGEHDADKLTKKFQHEYRAVSVHDCHEIVAETDHVVLCISDVPAMLMRCTRIRPYPFMFRTTHGLA